MLTLFFRQKREGVSSMEMVFDNLDAYLLPHQNICVPQIGAGLKSLWINIVFAYKYRREINHITGDVHYIAIGTGRNTVLTVHDVGSVLYGSVVKKAILKLFWFWIPAMIVKKITVISEFTKKELSAMIPFAKNKIVVIPNAFCPKIGYVAKEFNGKKPVILHMGTNTNKNLERTIEALKSIPCRLNVVGKLTDKQKLLLEESGIDFDNHFDVDFSEIVQYYHECDIVSFPSTYEGFGVPILEANAAGRPIIAGDISVLHEVAGDAACFVNSYSIESIHEGFVKIIIDYEYRSMLVAKGLENIKRFAPKVIAEKYNRVYEEINRK